MIRPMGNLLGLLAKFLWQGLQAKPVSLADSVLPRSIGDLYGPSMDADTTPAYLKEKADEMLGLLVIGIPSRDLP